jgi:ABC-type branched-subunit amino acid transport system substrate-binding protein
VCCAACCPAEFVRAAAAAKLDLPILGGDAIASPQTSELLKDNPSLLKNVQITAFSQGSEAFQKRFAEAAPGVEYDGNAAQGYDAMHAVLRAYMAAPAPKEPRDIAQQIPKQNFTGVTSCSLPLQAGLVHVYTAAGCFVTHVCV